MSVSLHSTIGASSASRWMACPGSVNASKGKKNTTTIYAAEGTAAHSLAETCLALDFDASELIGKDYEVDGYVFVVSEEMAEAVQMYVQEVRDRMKKGYKLFLEQRISLNHIDPEMFGTNDCSIYRPRSKHLTVLDYKHGKGIAVEARDNAQLLYYALGSYYALKEQGLDVKTMELVIVQPRCFHPDGPIRTAEVTKEELLAWEKKLALAVAEVRSVTAKRVPGDHCTFCPAGMANDCDALTERVYAVAEADFAEISTGSKQLDLPFPEDLPPSKIKMILDHAGLIETWLKNVRSFAFERAMGGNAPNGYKLVEKRAVRKFSNDTEVAKRLKSAGWEQDEYCKAPAVKSPAQIEKLLGKEEFSEELGDLVVKESSGLSLVPESDKRQGVDTSPEAAFAGIEC